MIQIVDVLLQTNGEMVLLGRLNATIFTTVAHGTVWACGVLIKLNCRWTAILKRQNYGFVTRETCHILFGRF